MRDYLMVLVPFAARRLAAHELTDIHMYITNVLYTYNGTYVYGRCPTIWAVIKIKRLVTNDCCDCRHTPTAHIHTHTHSLLSSTHTHSTEFVQWRIVRIALPAPPVGPSGAFRMHSKRTRSATFIAVH